MASVTQSQSESSGRAVSIPQSMLFWTCIVLSVVLFLLGMFVFTGPMSGIAGVWAASLFVGAILGYLGYLVWYRFEA
ncbi:hypothetical protein SAMN04487950_3449 [Halogranum rubrum]|uniref:Uncharacterized protein n=1 Tax=Halogranum rubrum TaxID=553466 RepID=A0A1I4GVL8_9EURY|nr:hypothetical protein [Halogranum rubrum]SFL34132.1 hypothetical protein SAMN04487950_3449 [Halogranum rubrum]